MTADLTTFIAGVSISCMASIDNTNYLLIGVTTGGNGHVMTLDYTTPATPTNPGNQAVSTYSVPNLHYYEPLNRVFVPSGTDNKLRFYDLSSGDTPCHPSCATCQPFN